MGSIDCLSRLSLFEDLSEAELSQAADMAEFRTYVQGEHVFREREPADRVFIVKCGHIKLYKVSVDGRELILEFLKTNHVLGEESVFAQEAYSSNAVAMAPTCVMVYKRETMETLFLKNPKIAVKVIRYLSRKLYQTTEHVSGLAFQDAKGRLTSTLLRLAGEYGRFTKAGVAIDLSLTHQDLANIVSLSRTTVTNLLLQLREEGLVEVERRNIVLTDQARLQDSAS